jgi:predicted nucleotidyltransferase
MFTTDFYSQKKPLAKQASICFARINPPTLGHKRLLETTAKSGDNYYIFVTKTHKLPDNPLPYQQKLSFIKEMFPDYAGNIVEDESINTVTKALNWVYKNGITDLTFVAGSDRLDEFKKIITNYNGVGEPNSKDYFVFENINFVSSGERDPDADDVSGISASKARTLASANLYEDFSAITGGGEVSQRLFEAVKTSLLSTPAKKPSKKKQVVKENKENSVSPFIDDFVKFAGDYLKLESLPKINTVDKITGSEQPSFGGYDPNTKSIRLATSNRHPNDILRTLAHELVHYKQDILGKIKNYSGETGSSEENQANTIAGIIMRLYNKEHPESLSSGLSEDEDVIDSTLKYHKKLCPVAFDGDVMRPEVRSRLLKIANIFIDSLSVDEFDAIDIVLTGSLANYNWTRFSDFDLHVITDYDQLECDRIAEEFFLAKKKIWNDAYDITIGGHEVEMYVEDQSEPPVSSGVYSILENKWVKKPEHIDPKIDDKAVRSKVRELKKFISKASAGFSDAEDVKKLFQKLRNMRSASLSSHGEFSVENLAYKVLRNEGLLDELSGFKDYLMSKNLSL